MELQIIRFPPYVDLRKPPKPKLRERLRLWWHQRTIVIERFEPLDYGYADLPEIARFIDNDLPSILRQRAE